MWFFGLIVALIGFTVYEYIYVTNLNDHLRHLPERKGHPRPLTVLETTGVITSALLMGTGFVLVIWGIL